MRALHGIAHAVDVEEEKSGLRGMRLDGEGAESRPIDFLCLLLCLLILVATGNGKRSAAPWISAADINMRYPTHNVIRG